MKNRCHCITIGVYIPNNDGGLLEFPDSRFSSSGRCWDHRSAANGVNTVDRTFGLTRLTASCVILLMPPAVARRRNIVSRSICIFDIYDLYTSVLFYVVWRTRSSLIPKCGNKLLRIRTIKSLFYIEAYFYISMYNIKK